MTALKEFVNFIVHHKTNLAETYARLLVQADANYAVIPVARRIADGRKLLNAVIKSMETGQSILLTGVLISEPRATEDAVPNLPQANPALALECLGQTLTPIVPNLEAGKYLWQLLAEVRSTLLGLEIRGIPPPNSGLYSFNGSPLLAKPDLEPLAEPAPVDEAALAAADSDDPPPYALPHPTRDAPPSGPSIEDNPIIDEPELQTMMSNYDLQLRTDSSYNIFLVTTVLAVLIVTLSQVFRPPVELADFLWLGAHLILPFFIGQWSWRLARNDRQPQGAWLMILAYVAIISFNYALALPPDSASPYFYSFFIVVSSTMIRPHASLIVWLYSTVFLLVAMLYRGQFLADLPLMIVPVTVNLLLAAGSLLTSLDWQEAIRSASILQIRAQRRRDELFAVQAELRRASERQKSLYTQLITSVEVGQRIAAVIDLDVLLNQVVDLIRSKLDFAYVGVFLLENNSRLCVQAQTDTAMSSDPVRILVSENNILSLAASRRQYIIVPDLQNTPFTSHPFLSDKSHSEIGMPLIIGDRLYGVLNIQSYVVKAFNEENLPMLRLLSNQVAIALHNAHLFNETILARQAAEQANVIKSRFLASMSHELRTPLNVILNFTGFVVDGVFGSVRAEQKDALEKSLDSGNHLLSLINDILDLAKIEAGSLDMFIQEVDMNNLLRSTAATATGLLTNKPVILQVDVEENLPPLSGDKRRLRQILLNLVSNAVKYTIEGTITLSAHKKQETIQIAVQDTGIGIPPEDQELIFESFHQSQNSLLSEIGTGLGLPIAKHFVEAHGGELWLESEVGRGSTFYVSLPIQFIRSSRTIASAQRED